MSGFRYSGGVFSEKGKFDSEMEHKRMNEISDGISPQLGLRVYNKPEVREKTLIIINIIYIIQFILEITSNTFRINMKTCNHTVYYQQHLKY